MNRERGPDPRLNAYREDLAAAHLRGEVKASRFAEGVDRLVRASVLPLLRRPEANAPMDTQLLFGETFRVFEEKMSPSSNGMVSEDELMTIMPDDFPAPEDGLTGIES